VWCKRALGALAHMCVRAEHGRWCGKDGGKKGNVGDYDDDDDSDDRGDGDNNSQIDSGNDDVDDAVCV